MLAIANSGETVLFEVTDSALALKLLHRLRGRWPVHLVGQDDARFVAVSLDPDDVSMEMLLQTVAEWAGEVGLRSVAFHVGDQMSVVVAREADDSEQ
jgi:hypothetical protein